MKTKLLHKKLKKTALGIRNMSETASGILTGVLKLSCAMLLCAFAVFISIGAPSLANWGLYQLALELTRTPAALLLMAVISVVCIEERAQKK
jgi:hypothetical protein